MDNPPDFIHASVFPSNLTDFEDELSVSSVKTANVMVQYVACNYMQQTLYLWCYIPLYADYATNNRPLALRGNVTNAFFQK